MLSFFSLGSLANGAISHEKVSFGFVKSAFTCVLCCISSGGPTLSFLHSCSVCPKIHFVLPPLFQSSSCPPLTFLCLTDRLLKTFQHQTMFTSFWVCGGVALGDRFPFIGPPLDGHDSAFHCQRFDSRVTDLSGSKQENPSACKGWQLNVTAGSEWFW